MDETLELLPGEGETQTIKRTRVRRRCDNCGKGAHYRYTFLLEGARSNPASNAYGRDDCSWCSDEEQYSCKNPECISDMKRLPGYIHCSTFPASERFAHLFLEWEERALDK